MLLFFFFLHQDVTSMMETCYGKMGSLFRSGKYISFYGYPLIYNFLCGKRDAYCYFILWWCCPTSSFKTLRSALSMAVVLLLPSAKQAKCESKTTTYMECDSCWVPNGHSGPTRALLTRCLSNTVP